MSESDRDTNFFESVYEVAALIPAGRVTSYGAIARYLGSARSSRMVGWAMNNSFSSDRNIPAHRVVNRNGSLTGKHHFPNEHEMQRRLEAEGIKIMDDQIVNFSDVFWDPNLELKVL